MHQKQVGTEQVQGKRLKRKQSQTHPLNVTQDYKRYSYVMQFPNIFLQ
jgi:hypothetical protein